MVAAETGVLRWEIGHGGRELARLEVVHGGVKAGVRIVVGQARHHVFVFRPDHAMLER